MPEEDRKSVGTEGTDVEVEEPFSPSTTTKDKEPFGLELDKYMSSSPMSHSPPEPISPSKERALSEDLSPVYDQSQDPRKMKIAVGLSPSEFIREDDELQEEEKEEENDEETAEGPTIGMSPTDDEVVSPMEEAPCTPEPLEQEKQFLCEDMPPVSMAFEPTTQEPELPEDKTTEPSVEILLEPTSAPKEEPYGAPQEELISAPQDDLIIEPYEEPFSALHEEPTSEPYEEQAAPQEELICAPHEESTSALKEEPISAPYEEPYRALEEEQYGAPKEQPTSEPQEELVSVPPMELISAPQEELFSAPQEEPTTVPCDEPSSASKEEVVNAPQVEAPVVTVQTPEIQESKPTEDKEQEKVTSVEFMSFDNMAFAGKERIDWEDSSKEGSEPEMDDVDEDGNEIPPKTSIHDKSTVEVLQPTDEKDIPPESAQVSYEVSETTETLVETKAEYEYEDQSEVPPPEWEELEPEQATYEEHEIKRARSPIRQSISSESGSEKDADDLDMSELQQQVGITSVLPPPHPVDISYSDEEPDTNQETAVRDAEQPGDHETGDVTPRASSPKQTLESHVPEPHESIERAYEAQVIDTIMERCTHDFEVSSGIQMEPTSFRIGQIEYQATEDGGESKTKAAGLMSAPTPHVFSESSEVQRDHPSATRTTSSESSSDTMTASGMTSSFMTATASLDASEYHTIETSVYEEATSVLEERKDQFDDEEPEEVSLENLPIALDVISETHSEKLQEEKEQMARVTSDASLDRTESASLDSEELEESYGDQKDEMVEECQVELMPPAFPPVVGIMSEEYSEEQEEPEELEEPIKTDEDKDESPVIMAEAAARLKHIEIGTPKPVESISSEELVKTSSSSDTSAEPTLLAATYDLDSGAISRVVTDYDISPDTVEKTLTVDSQPKAILSSPEDEVFESELIENRNRLKDPRSEESDDMPLVSFSPTHASGTIIEEPEPDQLSLESTEVAPTIPVIETDRPSSPFEMVDDSDLIGYNDYMTASLEFQRLEEERKAKEKEELEFGVGVGISAAAGAAVFAGAAAVIAETQERQDSSCVPEQRAEQAIRPSLSFGEQESPTFEHSSPISSSEPSDFRGPISPFDTPAAEPLPEIVQVEEPIAEEPQRELEEQDEEEDVEEEEEEEERDTDQYIHANGPTEVDFYPEHDLPYEPMQQVAVIAAEVEAEGEQELAPVAPVAAVAPEPVLDPDLIGQIEAPIRCEEQEIDQAPTHEEEFLLVEPTQPEAPATASAEPEPPVTEYQEEREEEVSSGFLLEETEEQREVQTFAEEEHEYDDDEPDEDTDPLRPEMTGSYPVEPSTPSDLADTSFRSDVIEPSAPSAQAVGIMDESYSTTESFSLVDSKPDELIQVSLTSSTELVGHAEDMQVPTGTVDTRTTPTTDESFRDERENFLLSESQQDLMTLSAGDTAYQTGLTESQTGLTASLMESLLDVQEQKDRMMESDQTLYNIEMPADELSASQTMPKKDTKLSDLSSLEEELADAAETVADREPSKSTPQALEEPQLLDRPPSSGKEALESDAMYTMFSGTVVTEVPPDYALQSMDVDDDYYASSTCYQATSPEGDGAYGAEQDPMAHIDEPQLEDGGDSLMECEDDELAALAEDTELDIPTGTDTSPIVIDSTPIDAVPEYTEPDSRTAFESPTDMADIERPQSPIPDESEGYWDEEGTEQRMDVDQGDVSPIRQEVLEEPTTSASPPRKEDDVLTVQASVFVHSVMEEAQATVQSGDASDEEEVIEEQPQLREEEDMSGSDSDYVEPIPRPKEPAQHFGESKDEGLSSSSGEVESDDDLPPPPSPPHVLQQFLPSKEEEEEEEEQKRVPESPEEFEPAMPSEEAPKPPGEEASAQATDDIPAITITQHLHKETDEEDYPTSYAPAHSPDEEEEEEEAEEHLFETKREVKRPVKPLGEFDAMFGDSAEVQVKVKFDDDASPLSPDTDSFLGRGPDQKGPKETRSGVVSSESEEDLLLDSPDTEVHVVRVEDIQHGRVEKSLPVLPEESPSKEKYEEDLMKEEQQQREKAELVDQSKDRVSEVAAAVVHGVIEAVRSDSFLGAQQTTRVSGLKTEGFTAEIPEESHSSEEPKDSETTEQLVAKTEESVEENSQRQSVAIFPPVHILDISKGEGEATPELGSPEHEEGSDMSSSGEGPVSVISVDSAIRQREVIDLQSPEDLGDSSSVDSFATVVATHQETMEGLEERLVEVASMTSSFHSDMQGSFHEDLPEAPIAIDVRDKEPDASKLSSSSSGEMFDLEAAMLGMAASPPDDDQYEVLHLMTGMEYPRLPRQLEVVKEEPESDQKDSSGETTSSSSERLGVVATDSSSERIYSSPDIPAPSPDIHGGRFFNKSNERDDVSVSSSLLEFERLEMEIGDKTSLESFKVDFDSPQPIYSRSLEKDDVSLSSSLAEFENLEGAMGKSESMEKVMVTPDSKSSVDNGSVSSLNEFERLERDFICESDGEKKRSLSSSSDSNHEFPLEKASVKSSTSSLNEFEQLEQEMYITEDLEIEAQKVVTLLESGALVREVRAESDMSLSEGASFKEVFISQEQLVEPEDLPRDETPSGDDQVVPQKIEKEEDMDRDSLGDAEERGDIERIIQEASRNVETFAVPTEAVLVSRTLQEVIRTATCESHTSAGLIDYGIEEDAGAEADDDSLDGRDDEEFKQDQAAALPIPTIIPSIVPAEQTTHEIDVDSLQGDSESHSKSGALDSDSLQDQDSVMQISAESFEMDPHGPTMSSSAEGCMLKSSDSGAGIMDRSADSLELDRATAAPIVLRPTEGQMAFSGEGIMERSADSLEGELALPQSDSKDSFDCDSLHEEEGEAMGASAEWPGELDPPRPHRHTSLMEMSMESGAWSQSSSLFSQDTMKSSASEAYKDIMRMSVDSPEYDKQTIIDMSEQGSERYSRIESVQEETESRHARFEQTETEVTKTVIDSEGNVHTTQTFERRCIDDENRQVSSYQEHEQMDVDSDWQYKTQVYGGPLHEPQAHTLDMGSGGGAGPTTAAHHPRTTHVSVESHVTSTPVAIPRAAPQYPSAHSSPSSESSHSENCYCGPDYAASMASGQRPDQPDHPLASRGSTNPTTVCLLHVATLPLLVHAWPFTLTK